MEQGTSREKIDYVSRRSGSVELRKDEGEQGWEGSIERFERV